MKRRKQAKIAGQEKEREQREKTQNAIEDKTSGTPSSRQIP